MRILLISQYFWPENFQINEVCNNLIKHNISLTVLTGKPNYPEGIIYKNYKKRGVILEEYNGIEIIRIPIIPRGKSNKLRLLINYFSFIISCLLFSKKVFKKKKFDLIFVYAPSPITQAIPAIIFSKINKIPIALWVQDLWPHNLKAMGIIKNDLILKFIEYITSKIYMKSDLILVQSKAFIKPILKYVEEKKVVYHPNSFYVSRPKSSKDAINLVKSFQDKFTILFAGNIGNAQNPNILLQISSLLSSHTNVQLVIIGEGSRKDWLLREKRKMKLNNLKIFKSFHVNEMPYILSYADALLVTLMPDEFLNFTVPSKLQAYFSAGKPIIGSLDGEGARMIIESEAGYCSPAGDIYKLYMNILLLLESSDLKKKKMGDNGIKYQKNNFALDNLSKDLLVHFNNLIRDKEW